MSVLQLGTIGTSMITELFVKAAHQTEKMALHAVYSRRKEKAESFGSPFKAEKAYDDLTEFLNDPVLDVVYIASPNSLHYEQTIQALEAKKHVIVEKPAFTQANHWDEVRKLAKKQGCIVIEAIRHMHEPNFKRLKEELTDIGEIQGATLPYMSYSSRYDLVLEGEEPNIFSPKFAGGALMDLGVYPLYSAVALFGEPEEVAYYNQKIATGVDGKGTAILRYPTFDVTLLIAKIATATIPAEIYGLDATLRLNDIAQIATIEKIDSRSKAVTSLATEEVAENMLFDEAKAYAEVLADPLSSENKKKVEEWFALSEKVGRTLQKLREHGNIHFPSDKK